MSPTLEVVGNLVLSRFVFDSWLLMQMHSLCKNTVIVFILCFQIPKCLYTACLSLSYLFIGSLLAVHRAISSDQQSTTGVQIPGHSTS